MAHGEPFDAVVIGSGLGGLTAAALLARAGRMVRVLETLDRPYSGFASAVTQKVCLNARSMRSYLNTPEGALYGLVPRAATRHLSHRLAYGSRLGRGWSSGGGRVGRSAQGVLRDKHELRHKRPGS